MSLGLDPLSGLGEIYLELTSWWSVLSEAVGIMISSIYVVFYVLCRWCSEYVWEFAMLTVMCFDWFLGPLFKRENSSFPGRFCPRTSCNFEE